MRISADRAIKMSDITTRFWSSFLRKYIKQTLINKINCYRVDVYDFHVSMSVNALIVYSAVFESNSYAHCVDKTMYLYSCVNVFYNVLMCGKSGSLMMSSDISLLN